MCQIFSGRVERLLSFAVLLGQMFKLGALSGLSIRWILNN